MVLDSQPRVEPSLVPDFLVNLYGGMMPLPERQTPEHTRIIYDEPKTGWCNPCCLCPCGKGRAYNRINEDSFEWNDVKYNVLCCDVKDRVHKIYFDQPPFTDGCCGAEPEFVSYKETCFFCGCVSCVYQYEVCCNPYHGELLYVAPCYCKANPICGRTCCVRCCSCLVLEGLLNSDYFAYELMRALKAKRMREAGVKASLGNADSPDSKATSARLKEEAFTQKYDPAFIMNFRYDRPKW